LHCCIILVWHAPTLVKPRDLVAQFLCLHKWIQLATTLIGLIVNLKWAQNTAWWLNYFFLVHSLSLFLCHYFIPSPFFSNPWHLLPILTLTNNLLPTQLRKWRQSDSKLPPLHPPTCLPPCLLLRSPYNNWVWKLMFLTKILPSQLTLWHLMANRWKESYM
jgi:hypothetical protein